MCLVVQCKNLRWKFAGFFFFFKHFSPVTKPLPLSVSSLGCGQSPAMGSYRFYNKFYIKSWCQQQVVSPNALATDWGTEKHNAKISNLTGPRLFLIMFFSSLLHSNELWNSGLLFVNTLVTLLLPVSQTDRERERKRECVCSCAARLNVVWIKFAHNALNIIRMQCTFVKSSMFLQFLKR